MNGERDYGHYIFNLATARKFVLYMNIFSISHQTIFVPVKRGGSVLLTHPGKRSGVYEVSDMNISTPVITDIFQVDISTEPWPFVNRTALQYHLPNTGIVGRNYWWGRSKRETTYLTYCIGLLAVRRCVWRHAHPFRRVRSPLTHGPPATLAGWVPRGPCPLILDLGCLPDMYTGPGTSASVSH